MSAASRAVHVLLLDARIYRRSLSHTARAGGMIDAMPFRLTAPVATRRSIVSMVMSACFAHYRALKAMPAAAALTLSRVLSRQGPSQTPGAVARPMTDAVVTSVSLRPSAHPSMLFDCRSATAACSLAMSPSMTPSPKRRRATMLSGLPGVAPRHLC